ncbi:hypothetical protein ACFXTH_010031 [Malus domestica]|uniref:Uncharacterized protein n=1 Tax=Malus domestica TaxID=3750 RepID=A0A498IIN4_MALDO|nr:hypothetical protein DVH24_036365 [Malus domestica]
MVGPKAADHKEAGPMATGPELPAFPKSVVANAIHSPKTGPKSESYQTVARWDWLKKAEWNSEEADED